jgi:outer membrane protein assembly factor BamB
MKLHPAACALALLAPALAGAAPRLDPLEQWGQWRGPLGSGEAPRADPPTVWDEGTHVRWKTPLPGRGQSSPVVWGDRVYLTTAIAHGAPEEAAAEHDHARGAHDNMAARQRLRFVVLALDRADGSVVWQREVRDLLPHASTHKSASWAPGSVATDGERIVAFFGSAGLFGLDVAGKLLWQVDLGDMQVKHGHGEGSSPALHGDTVVVNWDHEGPSFIAAFDKRTGKELWRTAREEATSWSSPLIVEHEGKPQVVVAATRRVRSYALADGALIWECGGLSGNVVATPVAADGLVHVANSYETRAMLAIRLEGARGDITGTDRVAWTRDRDTPYVPSPVLYDGALCFLKHYQGVWSCVDAADGSPRYGPVRLPGIRNVYASPVAAAGRLYVVDLDGNAVVLGHGGRLELLARNRLDESIAASPAIAGDELFLRGERSLYCLGKPRKTP